MAEENGAVEGVEEATRLPWFVATMIEDLAGKLQVDKIVAEEFKLQIEADAWIKENAEDSGIYGSFRKGKTFRVKTVRKLEEI